MLIGQAPGQVDLGREALRRPRGGLFRWLERAGLDEPTARDLLYISAITRCYPGPHPAGRGDRVPSPPTSVRSAPAGSRTSCASSGRRSSSPSADWRSTASLARRRWTRSSAGTHEIEHVGGRALAIPLPHPSGASSSVHQPGDRILLERALDLAWRATRDDRIRHTECRLMRCASLLVFTLGTRSPQHGSDPWFGPDKLAALLHLGVRAESRLRDAAGMARITARHWRARLRVRCSRVWRKELRDRATHEDVSAHDLAGTPPVPPRPRCCSSARCADPRRGSADRALLGRLHYIVENHPLLPPSASMNSARTKIT